MTVNIEALRKVAEAATPDNYALGRDDTLALLDRLEQAEARADAAEKVLERINALEPTWHRGMYGAPDNMYAGVNLTRIISAYQGRS